VPAVASRYSSYKAYAKETIADVFPKQELDSAVVKNAYTFATSLIRNNGDGSFTIVPLPLQAQIAPVYAMLGDDLDRDGKVDLLLAGNFDGVKPDLGTMTAGYGTYLRGDGKGHFTPLRAIDSGFFVPGEARDIRKVHTRNGDIFVVSRSNDRPLVFSATGRGGSPSAATGTSGR
jgi:hypothetical protein